MYEPRSHHEEIQNALREKNYDVIDLLQSCSPMAFYLITDLAANAVEDGHRDTAFIYSQLYMQMLKKHDEEKKMEILTETPEYTYETQWYFYDIVAPFVKDGKKPKKGST